MIFDWVPKLPTMVEECEEVALDRAYYKKESLLHTLYQLPEELRDEYIKIRLFHFASLYESKNAVSDQEEWFIPKFTSDGEDILSIKDHPTPTDRLLSKEERQVYDKLVDFFEARELFHFCQQQYDIIVNKVQVPKPIVFEDLFKGPDSVGINVVNKIIMILQANGIVSEIDMNFRYNWLMDNKELSFAAFLYTLDKKGYLCPSSKADKGKAVNIFFNGGLTDESARKIYSRSNQGKADDLLKANVYDFYRIIPDLSLPVVPKN
ncbi:hypothetical protein QNI19_26685 [Cytophagaceae bacterium DM2B3-1]|uniref:Uncharacterized protein n=1 Tax=Xanthocytophaga flava TaxID=3048013 RepID=A0ABT7CS24_9BACT|nr:hypothetical protein [Xanthocytophaga flavus]MDJ1496548.1 hypothetical protein [Xanthocytophaga flavus]